MKNLKIGIVIADPGEYIPFKNYYLSKGAKEKERYGKKYTEHTIKKGENSLTFYAALCGVGKTNASAQTAYLVASGCDIILNFGFSGGISNSVRNDFVLCESFLEHDFDLTMIGYAPCQKPDQDEYIYTPDKKLLQLFKQILPNAVGGCAVTGDTFISDKSRSDYLKNTFMATTCDMETAAIASVCYFAKVPFLSLRRVSDDASETAPDSYTEMNTSNDMSFARVFDIYFDKLLGEY